MPPPRAVIGTLFYVMEALDGRVVHDCSIPGATPAERAAMYDAMNEALAALHQVDWRGVGLEEFGRPGNYFGRQIARWTRAWHASKTREIPELDRLVAWLPAHVPEGDERYFEVAKPVRVFDSNLLREPLGVLPHGKLILLSPHDTVTDAVRTMQGEHRGYVLVTRDGTPESEVVGIFTERDVLLRIVDRGRNPATLPLSEVMTEEPETLPVTASIAYLLNKMSVGGFRHVPVVDDEHRPVCVISVRDVVTFLVNAFPREVLNLPTDPITTPPVSREGA